MQKNHHYTGLTEAQVVENRKKYGEIFISNPRVSAFIAIEDIQLQEKIEQFDVVYTCHYNTKTKEFIPLVLKG